VNVWLPAVVKLWLPGVTVQPHAVTVTPLGGLLRAAAHSVEVLVGTNSACPLAWLLATLRHSPCSVMFWLAPWLTWYEVAPANKKASGRTASFTIRAVRTFTRRQLSLPQAF
jgi:hypothetical protein